MVPPGAWLPASGFSEAAPGLTSATRRPGAPLLALVHILHCSLVEAWKKHFHECPAALVGSCSNPTEEVCWTVSSLEKNARCLFPSSLQTIRLKTMHTPPVECSTQTKNWTQPHTSKLHTVVKPALTFFRRVQHVRGPLLKRAPCTAPPFFSNFEEMCQQWTPRSF